MPKKWFIHLQGETFGSLSTELVSLLLHQNRLQFSDFGWTPGMKRWERFSEVPEFTGLMPKYPNSGIPSESAIVPSIGSVLPERRAAVPPPVVVKPEIVAPTAVPVKSSVRRSDRVAVEASVTVDGGKTYSVINLSATGLLLKNSGDLKTGIEIKFVLLASALGKPMPMTGITIREGAHAGEIGMAIEFTKVNPAHKRILQDYVNKTLTAHAA